MLWMDQALRLAESAKAFSGSCPAVGCVVVKDDRVIGQGTNENALQTALDQASSAAPDSDVYLTIEDITDITSILEAEVRAVHIALPHPLSNGQPIEGLRNSDIPVTFGDLEDRAYHLNQDYFHAITKKSPYIIAQWAMTMDGKMALANGDSQWISGQLAQEHSHRVRSNVNAIMVGGNTLRHDNPRLTVRNEGYQGPQPIPIILTASGKVPLDSHVMTNPKTIVITSHLAHASHLKAMDKKHIQHIQFPLKDGVLELKPIFERLYAQFQLKSILVEGGHQLLTGLYDEQLINEVHTYVAPKIMGGRHSLTPIAGQDIPSMDRVWQLHSRQLIDLDPDVCIMAKTHNTPKIYAEFKDTL